MPIRIYDCPTASAPSPFARSPLRYFVHRTAGGFSRLTDTRDDLRLQTLDRFFPMGQTSLWIMRRELLVANGKVHDYASARGSALPGYGGVGATAARRSTSDREGRLFLYGDDGSKLEYHYDRQGQWVLGFETLDEARESLGHPDISAAKRIVVATLLDEIGWH